MWSGVNVHWKYRIQVRRRQTVHRVVTVQKHHDNHVFLKYFTVTLHPSLHSQACQSIVPEQQSHPLWNWTVRVSVLQRSKFRLDGDDWHVERPPVPPITIIQETFGILSVHVQKTLIWHQSFTKVEQDWIPDFVIYAHAAWTSHVTSGQ